MNGTARDCMTPTWTGEAAPVRLATAVGAYPHTRALMDGRVSSPLLRLDVADIPVISRAFAPMVREMRFDVSEMAIVTFLQAKACGKPLVLLPTVLASRFQEAALLCRTDSGLRGPGDLAGRRVGVRAYSQTTVMWLRGAFRETAGVEAQDVRWVTFEDAHVAEIRDPPAAERAPPGSDLLSMLRTGDIDAAIVGNDIPDDPAFRTVYGDPAAAGAAFRRRHGFVPVNHVLTMRQDIAVRRPDLVSEVVRMFAAAAALAVAEGASPPPSGRAAMEPALALALRFMAEQGLLPHPLTPADAWSGLPPSLA